MTPQISLTGWEFTDTPAMLALFAELGADAVEPAPWNIAAVGVEEFGRLAHAHGLAVSCVTTGIDRRFESDPVEEVRQTLRDRIGDAVALRCPLVTTYVGGQADADYDVTIAAIREGIEPCARYASDRGVRILVENVFDTPGDDPEGRMLSRTVRGCRRLMEALADLGIGMTLDPCNFLIATEDPWNAFEQLRPFVGNIHVKDAVLATPGTQPRDSDVVWRDSVGGTYIGRPSGAGDSRLDAIAAAAIAGGFDGPLTFEHVVPDVTGPDVRERYLAEIDWARRLTHQPLHQG
jgi:sugar phosphate isomerase/epimerase